MSTLYQTLKTASQYRVDEVVSAAPTGRQFLARHHLDLIISECNDELRRWQDRANEFTKLSHSGWLPQFGGRYLYQYIKNSDCMIHSIRRAPPDVEAMLITCRPHIAKAIVAATNDYLLAIEQMRKLHPYPSNRPARIEWHRLIADAMIDTLTRLLDAVMPLTEEESPRLLDLITANEPYR
jgi:hypothetical protein